MGGKTAAIPAFIILLFGILLALPDEANIAVMMLESMNEGLCQSNIDNIACQQMGFYIAMIKIVGVVAIVGNIVFIATQFQKGNII